MKSKNSIWLGIMHMGLGTILAQLVNIVAQPLLTRLFSAEILGIYTYLISLATIVIPVASLKLDMLIVSEPDDDEAQYITDTCLLLVLILTVILTIVISIGYNLSFVNVFNKYGAVVFIVPFIVITNGIRFLFISYLNRYKEYKMISLLGIIRECARAIIQLGAGMLSGGVFFLTIGYAIAPLFGLKLQIKQYMKKFQLRPHLSVNKFREIVCVKGKKQILFLVPAQFINTFASSLVTISIATLYTAQDLGYYSIGTRILEIPIIFIAANVSKVCYQKISENIADRKPVFNLFLSIAGIISFVSFIGFSILYFIAPELSEVVFGPGYGIAGEYIKCLCIMYSIRLVSTSFAGIYTAFKKQGFELIINLMLIVSAIGSFIACKIYNYDIITYLSFMNWAYAFVYSIMLGGYIVACYRYDKQLIN